MLKSEFLDCRAVELEKKGHFYIFFAIFEILEDPFVSEPFQNVSVTYCPSKEMRKSEDLFILVFCLSKKRHSDIYRYRLHN